MKNYRIGELSKYLGVTPDFIKYYEKEGLIESIPETSPKLYPFNQSSKILGCTKLKSFGFSAKEMRDYLFCDTCKDYRETKKYLEYEIKRNMAMVKEIEDYHSWIETYQNDTLPYALENVQSFYFLKHTSFTDFILDDRIYEILNDWIKLMPMVKPTVHIIFKDGKISERTWGFSITQENVEYLEVPINEACTLIKKQKTLKYSLINQEMNREKEEKIYSSVINNSSKCGLKLSGEIYAQVLDGTADKRSTKTIFLLEP